MNHANANPKHSYKCMVIVGAKTLYKIHASANVIKMKVLFTSYEGLGHGGTEVSTMTLAEGLQRRGNTVIFASSETYDGFPMRYMQPVKKIPVIAYQNWYMRRFFERIIEEEEIELVHAHDGMTAIPAILAAKKFGLPVIVNIRDYWFACPNNSCFAPNGIHYNLCSYSTIFKNYPLTQWFTELQKWHFINKHHGTLASADVKICKGSAIKQKHEMLGITKDVVVVPPLRDLKSFDHVEQDNDLKQELDLREFVLLYPGSLTFQKGVTNLLDIAIPLLKKRDDLSLVIAGEGPLKEALVRKVAMADLADRIVFLGDVPYEHMPRVYSIVDLVLLPVLWDEPFSSVTLEAGAAGKPIIASNVGGFKDFVKGYLVLSEPFDHPRWRRLILKILDKRKVRLFLAQRGKQIVKEHYDMKAASERFEQVYEELLSDSY